ncbi:hypothetical protein FVEG_17560 [Fusarium verticillioides 7600]|uniref:Uncharacterized protein n=1 Tax=Gibberella moniliformis (strain M3125 / FGSC 7600) TaxID=334819 RepID=W7N6C2_GIBM7|nr:hypothetical protein FVEG_17560 [Fusarium verticillioides 7600]EWG55625.1 hypothetical protein FVEG_17560 [Fusarium verticillioides 7600]
MPALRETPSSQLAVQRHPLPSSAPKRTASQMDEDTNREGPSTPPRRIARRNTRGKKTAPKSRLERDKDGKSQSPSPSISLLAAPTEYAVATHFTIILGHGCIYYAEDSPPLFVPSTMMHMHLASGAYPYHCHQLQAASISQMQGVHMPSIGAPVHGHGVGLGWNENAWGYVPGCEVGDLSQMHGNLNFSHKH